MPLKCETVSAVYTEVLEELNLLVYSLLEDGEGGAVIDAGGAWWYRGWCGDDDYYRHHFYYCYHYYSFKVILC